VIALVVDGKEPLTKQDLALAQKAVDDGRCIVVVLNKMDAVEDKKLLADGVSQRLGSALWQAQGVECIPVSALNSDGVEDIMPAVCVGVRLQTQAPYCPHTRHDPQLLCLVLLGPVWLHNRQTTLAWSTVCLRGLLCHWGVHVCGGMGVCSGFARTPAGPLGCRPGY
jgi:hypothetical protein